MLTPSDDIKRRHLSSEIEPSRLLDRLSIWRMCGVNTAFRDDRCDEAPGGEITGREKPIVHQSSPSATLFVINEVDMFAGRILKTALALGLGSMAMTRRPIENETKRNFYENDANIVPVPGTVVAADGADITRLNLTEIVDGVSVRSTKNVEGAFRAARLYLANISLSFLNYLDEGYTTYSTAERNATQTLANLHDKREDLFPNSIYVIIAAMLGLIVARPRGLVARATLPLLFGGAAFRYFLPQTFANTGLFAWKLEERNFPEVARLHERVITEVDQTIANLEKSAENNVSYIGHKLEALKKTLAYSSGLKLDEDVSDK